MSRPDINWEVAPLSTEDVEFVSAYEQVGVPLDGLPYTDAFRQLARLLGKDASEETQLRGIYQKLLALQRRGVLPRIYGFAHEPRQSPE